MKRLLVLSLVVALLALAVPVWGNPPPGNDGSLDQHCDVSLDSQVIVTKKLTITQYRYDNASTGTRAHFEPKAQAAAEAVKNDLNKGNGVDLGDDPVFMDDIRGSFKDFCGIGQSNQSAGNMNNQGNTVAVAFVKSNQAYSSSLAAVGSINVGNDFEVNCSLLKQSDAMCDSFNAFTGIGQSNQAAGQMNNQNNVVGVSACVEDPRSAPTMVAMSGSELALTNTCNEVKISNAVFINSMEGSYKGFTGIGQSNQSAGNMNNQSNAVSVAVVVSFR